MTSTSLHDALLARPPATDRPRRGRRRDHLRLLRQFAYDARRFATHSAAVTPRQVASLRALVTMDAHRIEKALAVSAIRWWSGRSIITRLLANTAAYRSLGGDPDVCRAALDAMTEYLDRHRHGPVPEPSWAPGLRSELTTLIASVEQAESAGGTRAIGRESILKAARLDSLDFFASRHSIRQFDASLVTWQEIRTAVEAAQATPSVCNRQSWAVHAYPRGEPADTVLARQNGNAGFGHTASHVLVITVDLRTFVYSGERNQGWIDGGMFAMSLVYAFHALGIGTCCLNWSADSHADRRLRSVAAIPDHESVIMMLAIGRLPDTLPVARSARRPADEVLRPGRLRPDPGH